MKTLSGRSDTSSGRGEQKESKVHIGLQGFSLKKGYSEDVEA